MHVFFPVVTYPSIPSYGHLFLENAKLSLFANNFGHSATTSRREGVRFSMFTFETRPFTRENSQKAHFREQSRPQIGQRLFKFQKQQQNYQNKMENSKKRKMEICKYRLHRKTSEVSECGSSRTLNTIFCPRILPCKKTSKNRKI